MPHPRLRFAVRAVYGKRTDEIAAWLDEAVEGVEVLVVQGGSTNIAQGPQVADAAENSPRWPDAPGARPARRRRERPRNNGWPGAEAPIRELNAQIATLRAGAALSRDAGGPEAAGPDARTWTSDGDHPSVEGYRRLGELAFASHKQLRRPLDDRTAQARARARRSPPTAPGGASTAGALRPILAPRQPSTRHCARSSPATGREVIVAEGESGNPDAIYAYDPLLVGERGAVSLEARKDGRLQAVVLEATSRRPAPVSRGSRPGTIDGGDTLWLDRETLLVGRGYRTNASGVEQLRAAFPDAEVLSDDLPHWNGRAEVMHL